MTEVQLRNTTIEKMNKYNFWCLEHIGPQGKNTWEWSLVQSLHEQRHQHQAIRFSNDADATLFKLTFNI